MLIDDPDCGLGKLDGDGLASVAEADLDALACDLDAAAAGYPPLDCQAELRQRVWPGKADALQPVPLTGRDGARQGLPQDAVLGDDVHDLAVQVDSCSLTGQRGADLDELVAEGDDPGGADQPLDFHAAGRGQGTGRRSCRGRSCLWPAGSGRDLPDPRHRRVSWNTHPPSMSAVRRSPRSHPPSGSPTCISRLCWPQPPVTRSR
jgi:hypothetical protein